MQQKTVLEGNISLQCVKNAIILVNCLKEKLILHLPYVSVYLQAHMTPRDHGASVFSNWSDVRFVCNVACFFVILYKICSLLPAAQILGLSFLDKMKNDYCACRTYLSGKRVERFHLLCLILNAFSDSPGILTKVLNILGRPSLFSVEPSQSIFDPELFTFPMKITWRISRTGRDTIELLTTE